MNPLLSRRKFLVSMVAVPWLPSALIAAAPSTSTVFVNGHIAPSGKHFVSGFNVSGGETFRIPLPDEAHGFAIDPTQPQRIVSAPSLPGTRAVAMDVVTGEQLAIIKSRPGRHYLGHASFSQDGRYLFSSESIYETAEGIITVRDGRDFSFIRELPAYGIGPHDMRLMPDGNTLVVASGGIKTHPDSGRRELNLNTLKSALLFIDIHSGELVRKREVSVPLLSIRHLDVDAEGNVLVACQYKGRLEMPKLVGIQRGESEIEMFDIHDDDLFPLRNYTASACIGPGGVGAATCPRGDRLSLWDMNQKKLLKTFEIKDVGGIAVSSDGKSFVVSANVGELFQIDIKSLKVEALGRVWQNAQWTNHMVQTVA